MLHDTQDAGVVMSPIDHRKLHFRYRTAVNFVRLLILCGRREERERRRLSDWLTGGEWTGEGEWGSKGKSGHSGGFIVGGWVS